MGLKPVRNTLKPGCFSFKVGQDAIDYGYIYIHTYIYIHIWCIYIYIYMLIYLFVYSTRKIGMPTESVTSYRELLKSCKISDIFF